MLQGHRGRLVTKSAAGEDSRAWDDSKGLLESNILLKDLGVSQTLGSEKALQAEWNQIKKKKCKGDSGMQRG